MSYSNIPSKRFLFRKTAYTKFGFSKISVSSQLVQLPAPTLLNDYILRRDEKPFGVILISKRGKDLVLDSSLKSLDNNSLSLSKSRVCTRR